METPEGTETPEEIALAICNGGKRLKDRIRDLIERAEKAEAEIKRLQETTKAVEAGD